MGSLFVKIISTVIGIRSQRHFEALHTGSVSSPLERRELWSAAPVTIDAG
jgi:hypothetical protein